MSYRDREDGFTLIEILVVIGIIAILAAIAVPVFLNQKKNATQAQVESDLKNAALLMETEGVQNKGKFLSYVPNYDNRSAEVSVSLNKFMSSENKFCLIGKSANDPNLTLSYDSAQGGLLPKGQSCTPPANSSESFASILQNKKALIVFSRGSGTAGTNILGAAETKTYLTSYGFGTVDIQNNPAPSVYSNYDVIVALGRVWSIDSAVMTNLRTGFANGAKIITDGNDGSTGTFPEFFTTTESLPSGGAQFNQTGNAGLTPAFPYTFQETAFASDNWLCPTTVAAGTTVIANSPHPTDPAKKCLTAFGKTNGKGQWFHGVYLPLSGQTGMTDAALNWLSYSKK